MWTEPHGNLPIVSLQYAAVPIPQLTLLLGLRNMSTKMSIGHSYCHCGQHLTPVYRFPFGQSTQMLPSEATKKLKNQITSLTPTLSPILIEWKRREV